MTRTVLFSKKRDVKLPSEVSFLSENLYLCHDRHIPIHTLFVGVLGHSEHCWSGFEIPDNHINQDPPQLLPKFQ